MSARCPISALLGDNVVDRSEQTPWYDGPSLLELLEELPVGPQVDVEPFRFPVQYVIRPQAAPRGEVPRLPRLRRPDRLRTWCGSATG